MQRASPNNLIAISQIPPPADEVEEEAAVEAEEYFDFMDDGPKKGKVDLEVADDTDSHTTETSPKQGMSKLSFQDVKGCKKICSGDTYF